MKVYQIEISNYCNLSCDYCPHSAQKRKKGYMSMKTFKQSIDLLKQCKQNIAYLHNFGEPLLHPKIIDLVRYTISQDCKPVFYTNGILLDQELAKLLTNAGLESICLSEHTPGIINQLTRLFNNQSIPLTILERFYPRKSYTHNWAKKNKKSNNENQPNEMYHPCIFEQQDAFVILWDGRINTCCIDVECSADKGYVQNYLNNQKYVFSPIPLCKSCDLMKKNEEL